MYAGAPGESRFGSSMTSLGDLNKDGYLDVAVGAPYEGNGAIYIFLGSKDGLVAEPAQVSCHSLVVFTEFYQPPFILCISLMCSQSGEGSQSLLSPFLTVLFATMLVLFTQSINLISYMKSKYLTIPVYCLLFYIVKE